MDFESFRNYCLQKKGVTEDYPFEQTHAWMKVMDKLFVIANLDPFKFKGEIVPSFHFMNVKCNPEKAIELRERFDYIQPGWHMNKKHWNSVFTDNVDDDILREHIDHSYDLVVSSLSKKDRELLATFE